MGSLNFNPFSGNWFKKPKNPVQAINPNSLPDSLNPFKPKHQTPVFASISSSTPFTNPIESSPGKENPGKYRKLLNRYLYEDKTRPDYRQDPVVEEILKEDPVFEKKKEPTQEELEENEKWWSEFRDNPIINFLTQAKEIGDKLNEIELDENLVPLDREVEKIWDAVPNVIGLDGRPMPRMAFDEDTANDKFWDFARQFFFGLWGYKQRPYPPGRPIDVAQAIGYQELEKRYYDFIMKTGGFFYKDRLGRTRGPMELIQLKTAWSAGIIDKHTFVWGEDMDEWAPICMIYGMERAVATWEARMGAAGTAFFHNLLKGKSPWTPLKGHEDKTYKQAQLEAHESKNRDLAVLEANDGIWPGVRIPSHTLFLWASGTELTSILDADHMPNRYITKKMRQELEKAIPGLRPWEVLSIEQAMDQITYGGKWYREPLGSFKTLLPHVKEELVGMKRKIKYCHIAIRHIYSEMVRDIPGFGRVGIDAYKERKKKFDRVRREWHANRVKKEEKEWEEALGVGRRTP